MPFPSPRILARPFLLVVFVFGLCHGAAVAQCWQQVAYGFRHSAGIRADGTLWTWGWNDVGQLGDGSTTPTSVPQQVGTGDDWAVVAVSGTFDLALSAGGLHSAAIRADGTLWTWGWNDVGQLGNGTNTPVNIPQQVGFDSDWVLAVAAGSFDVVLNTNGKHTAAIKADGTLWTWGGNDHGQLGDGTLVDRNSPAQVGTDTWVAVQCGALHTVALRSDSTLWAWGYNTYGQLGLGNLVEGHTPTQVGTDTDWWQIVSTDMHCLALKSDSSLWSWGLNNYYQLGFFNDNQNKVVPTHVGSATNWRSTAWRTPCWVPALSVLSARRNRRGAGV